MKKNMVLASMLALVVGSVAACSAASSLYGIGGLIETPDDSIVPVGSSQLTGVYTPDLVGNGKSGSCYGGAVGVIPKLEVGAVVVDAEDAAAQGIVSCKYRISAETLVSPSITVGVVDLGKQFAQDEASMFVVIGKNLTNGAENVVGSVVKPTRGYLGFGTGIYRGGFAGIAVSAAPKADVFVEYLDKGIRNSAGFNGGVRFNASEGIDITAGLLDFKDFYGGVNYSVSRF